MWGNALGAFLTITNWITEWINSFGFSLKLAPIPPQRRLRQLPFWDTWVNEKVLILYLSSLCLVLIARALQVSAGMSVLGSFPVYGAVIAHTVLVRVFFYKKGQFVFSMSPFRHYARQQKIKLRQLIGPFLPLFAVFYLHVIFWLVYATLALGGVTTEEDRSAAMIAITWGRPFDISDNLQLISETPNGLVFYLVDRALMLASIAAMILPAFWLNRVAAISRLWMFCRTYLLQETQLQKEHGRVQRRTRGARRRMLISEGILPHALTWLAILAIIVFASIQADKDITTAPEIVNRYFTFPVLCLPMTVGFWLAIGGIVNARRAPARYKKFVKSSLRTQRPKTPPRHKGTETVLNTMGYFAIVFGAALLLILGLGAANAWIGGLVVVSLIVMPTVLVIALHRNRPYCTEPPKYKAWLYSLIIFFSVFFTSMFLDIFGPRNPVNEFGLFLLAFLTIAPAFMVWQSLEWRSYGKWIEAGKPEPDAKVEFKTLAEHRAQRSGSTGLRTVILVVVALIIATGSAFLARDYLRQQQNSPADTR